MVSLAPTDLDSGTKPIILLLQLLIVILHLDEVLIRSLQIHYHCLLLHQLFLVLVQHALRLFVVSTQTVNNHLTLRQ